jgi:hypothetical protein
MEKKKRPNGYWTLENLQAEALRYSTCQEFQHSKQSISDNTMSSSKLLETPIN